MNTTKAILAILILTLLASFAVAHDKGPQDVDMEYINPTFRDVRIIFTNPSDDMPNGAVNLCVAKDTLPANWDTQKNKLLRTSSMCKEAPFYGDDGESFGRVIFNTQHGRNEDTEVGAGIAPGRYIVSVILWIENPLDHHDSGLHYNLKLVNLALPSGGE